VPVRRKHLQVGLQPAERGHGPHRLRSQNWIKEGTSLRSVRGAIPQHMAEAREIFWNANRERLH